MKNHDQKIFLKKIFFENLKKINFLPLSRHNRAYFVLNLLNYKIAIAKTQLGLYSLKIMRKSKTK